MNVIIVHSEYCGIVGIARSEGKQAKWAVELLLQQRCGLLKDSTHVYWKFDGKWQWVEVRDAFGEDWKEFMKHLSIDIFNNIWDGKFYLEVNEIYGVDNATIY